MLFARPHRALVAAAGLVLAGCELLPAPAEESAPPLVLEPAEPLLDTEHVVAEDTRLVGALQVVIARHEDTLADFARAYNLGFDELRAANPDVDPWLPGAGTRIVLPMHYVLPEGPREGVVLNIATLRLHFYAAADGGDRLLVTHPVGIGRVGWETPVGETKVIDKARDPTWYPPRSIREEHAAAGDPLPAIVPPGPDNPLGRHVFRLDLPGYLIHGTNKPAGVGMRVSHGCVRLYPEDIESLYERIPVGMPVALVNQPILAAWSGDRLLLEAHPLLEEDERDPSALAWAAIRAEMARVGQPVSTIDRERVAEVLGESLGVPLPVSRFSPDTPAVLAAARLVRNIAVPPETEPGADETLAHGDELPAAARP